MFIVKEKDDELCRVHTKSFSSFLKKIKLIEAVVRMCSVKKVFLEISHDSQENTCVSDSFLIKLQARPAMFC